METPQLPWFKTLPQQSSALRCPFPNRHVTSRDFFKIFFKGDFFLSLEKEECCDLHILSVFTKCF